MGAISGNNFSAGGIQPPNAGLVEESSIGNIGASFTDATVRDKALINLTFLTTDNPDPNQARVSGYVIGGQVMDLPASLQNKTMGEIKTAISLVVSELPPELQGEIHIDQAPFPKATGLVTSGFRLETDIDGKITSFISSGTDGSVTKTKVDPALTFSEFTHTVRSGESAEMSKLSGTPLIGIVTSLAQPQATVSTASVDGSLPQPRVPVGANPFFTPSMGAELFSILMQNSALKGDIAGKQSVANQEAINAAINNCYALVSALRGKRDAEILEAKATLISAFLSLVGSVTQLGGSVQNQRQLEADRKLPKQDHKVADIESGPGAQRTGADASTKRTQENNQRTKELENDQEEASNNRQDQLSIESGRGSEGSLHIGSTQQRGGNDDVDAGEPDAAGAPMPQHPTDDRPKLERQAGSRSLNMDEDKPKLERQAGSRSLNMDEDKPKLERQAGSRSLNMDEDKPKLERQAGSRSLNMDEDKPKLERQAGSRDLNKSADADKAPPAPEGANNSTAANANGRVHDHAAADKPADTDQKPDKEMAHARHHTRGQVIDGVARMAESTGRIQESYTKMIAADARFDADRLQTFTETANKLNDSFRQELSKDISTVDSEFKGILDAAKDLIKKETDLNAQLFTRM